MQYAMHSYILTNLVRKNVLTMIWLPNLQHLPCSTVTSFNGSSKEHHYLRLCTKHLQLVPY